MPDPCDRVCGHCRHSACGRDNQLECRRFPPTVIGEAAFSNPIIPGGPPRMNWFLNILHAPVMSNRPACGEFGFREEVLN